MDDFNYDPIFEYNMNLEEMQAYKIGLLWMSLCQKIFPDYRHDSKYPKKGDPRKSSLFKYSYKMLRETKGKIKDYNLYLTAQLQMLKSIQIGDTYPLISCWSMCGEKAWKRWTIWERKFNNISKSKTLQDVNLDKVDITESKNELNKTKEFLEKKIKITAQDVERWIVLGKVSGFYASISPWVKKYCKLDNVDLSHYKENMSDELKDHFNKLFPNELNS